LGDLTTIRSRPRWSLRVFVLVVSILSVVIFVGVFCGDRMVVGFTTTCAISTYRTYLLHMDVHIFILIKQLYKQGVEIHIILFTTLPCAVAK
jgi:hypothetical protein